MTRFSNKAVGIGIVAAIILGSTAILGCSMVAAQAAANAALDSRPASHLISPLSTTRPEAPTPQPKDLDETSAIAIAGDEIMRVFGHDASKGELRAWYDTAQTPLVTDGGRCAWYIGIELPAYSYRCELDSVTGMITCMRRESRTAPVIEEEQEAQHAPYRLMPGKSYYETVARDALATIAPNAAIADVRFLRSTYGVDGDILGNRWVYNFIVVLEEGGAYSILIDKEDYDLVGYSRCNRIIDDALFEGPPGQEYIDVAPSVDP